MPKQARAPFIGALIAGFIAFAAFALFNSLAPTFLAGPLHHPSLALAGATSFTAFSAGAAAQILLSHLGRQALAAFGALFITAGAVAIVVAVQLSAPSLWLFLVGGAVLGAGAGAYFKSALGTVIAASEPHNRAGALTVLFLIAFIGLSIPAVGLGVLAQEVAAKTALLIFSAMLVAGVALSSGFLLRQPETTPLAPSDPEPV